MPAATSLAIASIGVSAAGAGASFVQASRQSQLQQKAEAEASRTLEEARKKLDVNFYEQLGINKEAYELEREALLVQGAQAIDAAVESERGAASAAGRVQLAQQEGQAGVRMAMAQDVMGLNKLVAGEDSRLRDMKANLDLAEAQGAQLAARDAQQAATASITQGIAGVQSAAQQGLELIPLFGKTQSAKALADLKKLQNETVTTGKKAKETESEFTKFGDAIKNGLGIGVGISALSLLEDGLQGTVQFLKDSVREALEAEQSQKKLAQALRASGDASIETLNAFTEYAGVIQETTKYTDDQASSFIALAANLGAPKDRIKEIVDTALDLSAAVGVDANGAVEALTLA